MSLNPLDPDQKDVALAIGASYAPEIAYAISGKAGSKIREHVRKDYLKDSEIDLGEPDEVLSEDPRVEIHDFRDNVDSKPAKNDQKNGGDNEMTNYQGPNFWEDVKTGMEDLDDDLDDLANYVENGDLETAVNTMVAAANQAGGYDEARDTAEAVANYLGGVQDDVTDINDDLEVHQQELEQAAQDLQDTGFTQDELDSMDDIQQYVANR